ncbi:hypothetical protein DL765_007017 [Monosporascus sp. GIB2]|nr:hypothetical protein DL765_007017 [Monosporascus sp. GIB2]
MSKRANKQLWVSFEGAGELSEGKYATFIPLEYGMDPANDVILAYEMDDLPLNPDNEYPVRLMVPGFVTEKHGEFAETLFDHPDTACYEQNLNPVIVKPAQGEKISLNMQRPKLPDRRLREWIKSPTFPPSILFRHPTEPATSDGGWMKPSVENQVENVKQQVGTPQKQFTRQKVEKHDNEHDCSIVRDGKVCDATSVLAWNLVGKPQCYPTQIVFTKSQRISSLLSTMATHTKRRKIDPAQGHDSSHGRGARDGDGAFDLTRKTYFPDDKQPGGAMSNILARLPIGEQAELRDPTGEIVYSGNGNFMIAGQKRPFNRVSPLLGRSGITLGYALIARIPMSENDGTTLRVVDANKNEKDILLCKELDDFKTKSRDQLSVAHALSHPGDSWEGLKGHVNEETSRKAPSSPKRSRSSSSAARPLQFRKLRSWRSKVWHTGSDSEALLAGNRRLGLS